MLFRPVKGDPRAVCGEVNGLSVNVDTENAGYVKTVILNDTIDAVRASPHPTRASALGQNRTLIFLQEYRNLITNLMLDQAYFVVGNKRFGQTVLFFPIHHSRFNFSDKLPRSWDRIMAYFDEPYTENRSSDIVQLLGRDYVDVS